MAGGVCVRRGPGLGDRLFGGQGRALGPRGVSLAPDRFLQRRDRGFLSSVPDLTDLTDALPDGLCGQRRLPTRIFPVQFGPRSVSRLGCTLFGSPGIFGASTCSWPYSPAQSLLAYSCHAESYRARTRQFSRCQGQIDALTHIGTPVPQGIWGDVVGHEVSVQAVRSLLPCRVFTLASGAKRLAEEAWVPAI